ncbi:hypothetical protein ACWKW6_23190 [Dyadobacter jiangsuensis]
MIGSKLANSFHGGDASTGKLVSPPSTIESDYINLMVGGGRHQNTAVSLIIDNKILRTATGNNSESLIKLKVNNIQSCQVGPEISPEQFKPEHFFLYLLRGSMKGFDGNKHYQILPGDYCIARKNHLIRYTKYKDDNQFEKIIITFDEPFLRTFLERHPFQTQPSRTDDSFLFLGKNKLIEHYSNPSNPIIRATWSSTKHLPILSERNY